MPSETVEVVVDALGAQGDALATWAGRTLYVPGALPGERVRVKTGVKKGDGLACQLVDVLDADPARAQPLCPHFGRCGGCQLQHLGAEAYAAWKRARIEDVLSHRGFGNVLVDDPVLIGPGTRRRATFSAQGSGKDIGKNGARFGFNARTSHDIVDIQACPVLTPRLETYVTSLRELAGHLLEAGRRARFAVTECANGFDILIEADGDPTLAQRQTAAAFVARGQALRIAWQEPNRPPEPLAQAEAPRVDLSGVAVDLPMGAFLQASAGGERAILKAIEQALDGCGRIADLFCGLGSFTLPLARHAIVRAVDTLEAPVRALERAAGHAGLGGRVLAQVRDLDRRPLDPLELDKLDGLVFDPPRAGAQAQVQAIARSRIPKVAAVSCNPATFARDARILAEGGYRLARVTPVDQFAFSAHVELVAAFVRD